MLYLSCPRNEKILEYVSIAKELSRFERLGMGFHLRLCSDCHTKAATLSERWQSFFQPEPDLTSSLLRVYSRLQKDETLVIKGWKLNDSRLLGGRWQLPRVSKSSRRWAVGGGMVSAIAASLAVVFWIQSGNPRTDMVNASANMAAPTQGPIPFAQIRLEDKNRVQVHYVQPELLKTIEFETTNQR